MTDAQTEIGEQVTEDSKPAPLLVRFAELEQRQRELQEQLDRTKKDKAAVASDLLDEWADAGIQNSKINGFSVHIRNDFYCNKAAGVPMAAVCDALRANGFSELVGESYSSAALKSRVKELAEQDQVPEELQVMLRYDTVPRIVATKA